ncbi:MAG TPA: hypothetical protein VFU07_07825 [Candidatus Lumbricidophila sp.]|nr:hypothetical protein [Candidatus Lumbricidophila sp.]
MTALVLPHRRQPIARFLKVYDLTYPRAAQALGIDLARFTNLVQGHSYPSPDEIAAITALFNGMPVEALFDASALTYRDDWPPRRGRTAKKAGA